MLANMHTYPHGHNPIIYACIQIYERVRRSVFFFIMDLPVPFRVIKWRCILAEMIIRIRIILMGVFRVIINKTY